MSNYRRLFVPGGTFFFTVNLRDRGSDLLVRRIDLLRESWRDVVRQWPFETIAAVVLPDLEKADGRKGERNIWQRRYWEHAIRDEADLEAHVDYIYRNPVKHGHAAGVGDWPFSTWSRDAQVGGGM